MFFNIGDLIAQTEDILLFYSKYWMQSGTLKDERHTESAPPPPLRVLLLSHVIAVDLVLLIDICTKMNLLLLMTAFRTREPPVCTVANFLQRFLRAVLLGEGRVQTIMS